jgi:serine/threonine-protein kinase RsbW
VRLELAFPAVPVGVAAIRRAMAEVAADCGMDEVGVGNVRLAVSEAATNAVIHAYRAREGEIRVTAEIAGGELRIVVADDGAGVSPRADSPGIGLGLPIIASVARRMHIVSEGRGTEIHLVFECPSARAA